MKASAHGSVAAGAAQISAAFFFVALMGTLAKLAPEIHPTALAFFQSFVALVLFAPWALRHGLAVLKTRRIAGHLWRAVAGLASQALMFVAVRRMPLVDAVLLANSAPLLMPLLSRLFYKQTVPATVWVSVGVGLVGIVLILKPSAALFSHADDLVAVAASVFAAFALLAVQRLSTTERSEAVLLYYFLFSSLLTLPFAIPHWPPPTRTGWGVLIGVGVSMAIAQGLILGAYREADANQIAPFNYTVVIFSGLLGWWFWGHVPDATSLIGIALVTVGGVMSLHHHPLPTSHAQEAKCPSA